MRIAICAGLGIVIAGVGWVWYWVYLLTRKDLIAAQYNEEEEAWRRLREDARKVRE